MLVCSDAGLHGYGLTTGDLLWGHDWKLRGMGRIVQPLVFDNSVIIGTSYGLGSRRIDVSRRDGWLSGEEIWTSTRFTPYFNDFVYLNGYVYGFNGRIFTCIDAGGGERQWKGGRYGNGQVLLVADMSVLLVLSETGEVVLVEAAPHRHNELARFQAIEGKTWNHPVIADGKLFVRNSEEAACFELPTE